jgi:alpha-galactosidase
MMRAANNIASKGFKEAGCEYVVVDDCWSVKSGRDNTTNRIRPGLSKFPDGIDCWVDKVHALGLKAGIYWSTCYTTCSGYPASLDYEMIDVVTFAGLGIDYLKYDNSRVPR